MTFDKFTIKAQEAVQAAVNTAQRNGQQTIEPVHLLSGIIVDRLGADYPRQCFAGSRDLLYRIPFLEVLPHKK